MGSGCQSYARKPTDLAGHQIEPLLLEFAARSKHTHEHEKRVSSRRCYPRIFPSGDIPNLIHGIFQQAEGIVGDLIIREGFFQ